MTVNVFKDLILVILEEIILQVLIKWITMVKTFKYQRDSALRLAKAVEDADCTSAEE